jgi:microcystin-dependent protein
MTDYCGELRIFPFGFAPNEWLECNGQYVSSRFYSGLYFVLQGQVDEFDNDGDIQFQIPDLRGRVPLGLDANRGTAMFETGGQDEVTIFGDFGAHTHPIFGSTGAATSIAPTGSLTFAQPTVPIYASPTNLIDTQSSTVFSPDDQATPHENAAPSLAMTFCICAFGVVPNDGSPQ